MVDRLPELTITAGGREHRIAEKRLVRLGRDPSNDVVLEAPSVSRTHASLEPALGGWMFRDAGSRYGVFHGDDPVSKLLIGPGERLSLSFGQPRDGTTVEILVEASSKDGTPPMSSLGRLSAVHPLSGSRSIVIGRHPTADVVLADDMTASRRHAEIAPSDAGWELHDLRSHNGTFLNGSLLEGAAPLADGDLIGVGAALYRFSDGALERYESSGEAWLLAVDLTSELGGGTRIVDGVSFPLAPASLLAVVGPSGAGKTTLLGALTGFHPATSGQVLYGGRDLYAAYAEFRGRTGYVPQEDVLHGGLTVRAALTYAARLRFAPDVEAAARDNRIDEVLAELGLEHRAAARIESLSGGQRKRVSVALELLTRPELLFLDEPTSGLDPGNEAQVMALLRDLANGGRMVVVVTHSVQSLEVCDRLLFLAAGGRTAYFGPPSDATTYFSAKHGADRFADVFKLLDEQRDYDWHAEYRMTPQYRSYIEAPIAQAQFSATLVEPERQARRRGGGWFRQVRVLTRRYGAVLAADRRNVGLMAVQAPLFGILYLGLIGQNRFTTVFGEQATTLIWLLVIGATWLGTSNAIREIVKEYPIFRRERLVGLSPSAYVVSKLLVLGPITVIQGVLLVLVATSREQVPAVDPTGTIAIPSNGALFSSQVAELCFDIALAGLAAMAIGLAVSAVVKTSDRALVLLPLILIAQMITSVPFFEGDAVIRSVGDVSTAQWGTAAAASTTSLNQVRAVNVAEARAGRSALFDAGVADEQPQPLVDAAARSGNERWLHRIPTWAFNVAMLALLTAAAVGAAVFSLRLRDRMRGVHQA